MDFLLRGCGLAQPLNDYEFSGGRSFRVFEERRVWVIYFLIIWSIHSGAKVQPLPN